MNTLKSNESGDIKNTLKENLENLAGVKIIESFGEEAPKAIKEPLPETVLSPKMKIDFEESFGQDIDKLRKLNPNFVGESVLEDVRYTYAYLGEKFEKTKGKLSSLGLTPQDLRDACTKRIIDQVIEASENGRNLKNGRVASLLKYENNKLFLQEIPYYAFACTNVSLDDVKIGNRTLREVVNLCNNKTDDGEFMLPNSLGISVSVMAYDKQEPVIIGQVRNNKTTLTQRSNERVVASASGAIKMNKDEGDIISGAAAEELEEELGLNATEASKSNFRDKLTEIIDGESLLSDIGGETMTRELGVSEKGTLFRPSALVIEDMRMNPEIVCHAIETNLSLKAIKESWKNAQDQYESLEIKGISMSEISENIKGKKNTLDKHFMMSLLGWTGNTDFQKLLETVHEE